MSLELPGRGREKDLPMTTPRPEMELHDRFFIEKGLE